MRGACGLERPRSVGTAWTQGTHTALSWAGDMVRECCVLSVNVYICQIIMMEKNRFGVG